VTATNDEWIGREEERCERILGSAVEAMAATLDLEHSPQAGEPLPPGWQWLFFNPVVRCNALGIDGHPRRGGFLPPIELPRRIWAGSRIRSLADLPVEAQATRRSRILKIENKTQSARSVKACRLKITLPDGTSRSGERITGDLDKWRIDADREEWDLWDTYFTTEAKPIPEFGMAESLGPGDQREGWLHFLARNTNSPEIQTCSMEVAVEDSLAITHLGAVNCSRHVPGKVHLSEESPA